MRLGKVIKQIIKDKGVFENYIAEKAGISSPYLSNIESGVKNPTLETLLKISNALDIPMFVLVYFAIEETDVSEQNIINFQENTKKVDIMIESIFRIKRPQLKPHTT